MLSAQLDGEDDPVTRPLVDEHLAECAGCQQWLDRAATVVGEVQGSLGSLRVEGGDSGR